MNNPTLDSFTSAYLQTALWSSTDDEGDPLDANHSEEDFDTATFAQAIADCARFQTENADTLAQAVTTGAVACGPDFNEMGRAGHDFWLTRNGHGAGFWDGDWPEPFAAALSEAARAFRGVDLYVGDDGQIYS